MDEANQRATLLSDAEGSIWPENGLSVQRNNVLSLIRKFNFCF